MAISISPIYNFDQIPLETATRVLYDNIVPKCEENNVKLSYYGNHTGIGISVPIGVYNEDKQAHRLFNVGKVQEAFKCLDEVISSVSTESISSYNLKQLIKKQLNKDINNGDCIAAMLMKGYIADFRSASDERQLNASCQFNSLHSV